MAVTNVTDEHDLMINNRSGITIRMRVADLRVLGRATQGVKLIDLRGKDYIASITKVPTEETQENTETPATDGQTADETANESLQPESNNADDGGTNNTEE